MIYLIRHGQSEANVEGVFAGQKNDASLTEKGIEQAKVAGENILKENLNFSRIISSPLKRTKKTTEIIAEKIGFDINKIEYDSRIIEYDMGALTSTPIRKVTSQELVSSDGAEDAKKFQDRVISALNDYAKIDGNILFVVHAGVGRIIEAHRIGLDPNKFYNLDPYSNGQLIELKEF